jgi:CDP-glucose 4,6-dehydratase
VLELVREILRIGGYEHLSPDVRGEAQHEILHQYLDATKARQMLGWRPKFDLEKGLANTWEWYKEVLSVER